MEYHTSEPSHLSPPVPGTVWLGASPIDGMPAMGCLPALSQSAASADLIESALVLATHSARDTLQLSLGRGLLERAVEEAWTAQAYDAVIPLASALARVAGRGPSLARAERHLRLGILACREVGDRHQQAVLTNRLGLLLFTHGRYALGWRLWRPGLALDSMGRLALWEPVASFATLVDLLGRYSALDIFLAAAERAAASGDPLSRDALAVACFIRGFQRRHLGLSGARDDLTRCLHLLDAPEAFLPEHRLLSLVAQCELARLLGDEASVRAYVEAASGLAALYADTYTLVALLIDQGDFAGRRGNATDIRAAYERLSALTYEGLPLWRNGIGYLGGQLGALGQAPADVHTRAALLTEREVEVLRLVASGLSNRQAAALLGVSASTVKKHLEHVYTKLGAASRTAAVASARERGILA